MSQVNKLGYPHPRELAPLVPSHSIALRSGVWTPVEFRRRCPECPGKPASTGLLKPEINSAGGSVACAFRESRIRRQSLLLFANRGYAGLEVVPTPCKQRATILSNRGEMRVVHPRRLPIAECPSAESAVRARTVKLTPFAVRTRMKFVLGFRDPHFGSPNDRISSARVPIGSEVS
jgi:hypothetical protein